MEEIYTLSQASYRRSALSAQKKNAEKSFQQSAFSCKPEVSSQNTEQKN
jgi:hypothetical protein